METPKDPHKRLTGTGDVTRHRRRRSLTAADVMIRKVLTVRPETTVDKVSELFQVNNINGAPVVDDDGRLVGIITEDDLIFGQMGLTDDELDSMDEAKEEGEKSPQHRRVSEIMTPNPIAAEEETTVEEICRLMWRLKIHRIPIVKGEKVTGIVSTIDVCRLVAEGRARLLPPE